LPEPVVAGNVVPGAVVSDVIRTPTPSIGVSAVSIVWLALTSQKTCPAMCHAHAGGAETRPATKASAARRRG